MGIVRNKLSEHDVAVHARLNDLKAGENITVGPFNIEFIRVNHSTVDGVGLAIRTPEGLIIHTGDFKINNTVISGMMTDVNRFASGAFDNLPEKMGARWMCFPPNRRTTPRQRVGGRACRSSSAG